VLFVAAQNVLSGWKDILLCSGEHKNPSGTDWGNAFQTPGCATCGEPCRSGAKLRP